ncbi:hypothetical protein FCH28_30500 [Streptomyces piniterrae]|uniref:Uncharacterized protein n=1 Tax=Streptomyces piniterrae TaxID=2571125 RepID=A0A4U0MUF4_9ACTN|nr:hypothetical protein [Streptomyces piniterrae]TJZ44637.1 hypothetical protein FCH28_30500 [Streptomyces piniterrae]
MDQGVAAVIAAGAGLVGAMGGAAVAGIAAVRGARVGAEKTARAMQNQVDAQARHVREDWLLQQRVDASLQFLSAYDLYIPAARSFQAALSSPDGGSRQALHDAVRTADRGLTVAYYRLRVFGPADIQQSAGDLRAAVSTLSEILVEWELAVTAQEEEAWRREETVTQRIVDAANAHDAFTSRINEIVATLEVSHRPATRSP